MFSLCLIEDDLRVSPQDLTKSTGEAVASVIESRFLDKVIPDVGLAVSLYDVTSVEGGFIYPNDGAAYFKSSFRLVVFRPFGGEVLIGKIKSSNRDGVRVTLGFFDDVIVPEHALQEPSFFDEQEQLWIWKFDGNDMYMDIGEEVRVRVHSLRFNSLPTPIQIQNAVGEDKLIGTAVKPFAPMEVIGDINGDGLGLLSWWAPPEEDAQ